MNETTLPNPTTVDGDKGYTKQPRVLPVTREFPTDQGILIGASTGAACAFIIILILLIVCLIKTRRSRANLPPMLPHPHSLSRFEFNEPSIFDPQSDLHGIYTEHPDGLPPTQHIWEVQEPVIHSPTEFPEFDRISYIIMSEPSRRLSLSPPSPELAARGSKQLPENKPPPSPCTGTSGYINIPRNRSGRSPASPATLRKNSNANDFVENNFSTKEDENNQDNYEHFQEMILAGGNGVYNKFKCEEESFHNSFSSREIPQHRLPDLLTSTRFHKDFADAHPGQNVEYAAMSHRGDGSSSDNDTPASPGDGRSSYVNVSQYKIASPVKESVVIDLSRSPFPKLSHGDNVHERRSQRKPSASSLLPQPSITYQQQPTTMMDTYQINIDLYDGNKSKQNDLNRGNLKLSSRKNREHDIDSNTYGQISPPATYKAVHSASTKFLTTGKIHTKNQHKGGRGRKNQRSRSHSYQEETGVYQNFMAISISDSKLPQETPTSPPTSPVSSDIKDIHSKTTNDLNNAEEFHLEKPQFHINKKMDQTDTTSQQGSAPSVVPRSYLSATKFESNPNVAHSEEIHQIRSKLRKVN